MAASQVGGWLDQILPRPLDNGFRGHVAALWLFVPVWLVKTAIAFGTIFNGKTAAQRADGIPLESFGTAGAQAVVAMFAIWGLAQLTISVFGLVAFIRYRALIPFMFALLLAEHLVRRWILTVKPVATAGAHPGSIINTTVLALMVVGLALSLWRPGVGAGAK